MFDEDEAIDAAMRAFWHAGYEATSTQDLCAATGLGRSSIYNTFTSKRDLFEKALDRYMETKAAAILEVLEGDLPIVEKIQVLFRQAIDIEVGDPAGCLVVNTVVELAPRDPEIAARLQRDHERRLAALHTAIDAGRRVGEIATDKDPEALAHFVIATIGGMRVAARAGADRATLEMVATTALCAF
ncbi:TetR/AcrR family transcriptional regulator [Micromonospora sp. NPDC003197]